MTRCPACKQDVPSTMKADHREILNWMHRLGGLGIELHCGYRPARSLPTGTYMNLTAIGLSKRQLNALLKLGFIESAGRGSKFNLTSAGRMALGFTQ